MNGLAVFSQLVRRLALGPAFAAFGPAQKGNQRV
jgi:hypothetical protein